MKVFLHYIPITGMSILVTSVGLDISVFPLFSTDIGTDRSFLCYKTDKVGDRFTPFLLEPDFSELSFFLAGLSPGLHQKKISKILIKLSKHQS
jgi:hypothetical protein